ncbi:MAG: TadE family protein [Pseudomonadota bacterium]
MKIQLHKRFLQSESGASLIEYAIVISLFLLVFFAILDFGRLGFNWVMTEKAMQRAARIAVSRPPICAGVPDINVRGTNNGVPYGAMCRDDAGICANAGQQICVLSAAPIACDTANPSTATEIWCIINPILPSNATPQNIRVSYTFDSNLGFLGGPYTPMVELAVVTAADVAGIDGSAELRFDFITPLPGLAALVGGGTPTNLADSDGGGQADIPFPDLSVSMPAEDLAQGNNG